MKYTVSDLIAEVRVVMDRNNTSAPLLAEGDIDTLTIEEIIEASLPRAARIIEGNAPHHLIDSGKPFGQSISWESRRGIGSGSIHLPDDYLRLVVFQMSDWSRPVTETISEDDDEYAVQRSRYGVKGNPQRPVVAVVQQPIGLVLEFYSCEAGDKAYVKRARYLPIPKVRKGKIELCEKLKDAVVYYTGYLAYLSLGDANSAALLRATANQLAEIEEQTMQ